MRRLVLEPSGPGPAGAWVGDGGVHWRVFSDNASAVEVCLFDAEGREERLPLPGRDGSFFHGFLPGVGAGLRYGLRAHGPYDPARGHRFNPHKLLIDPLARHLDGPVIPHPALFGFDVARGWPQGEDDQPSGLDSAPFVPKAIVVDPAAPSPRPRLGGRLEPGRLVIYEAHVKGMTQQHPEVETVARGTFAGFAAPGVVDHLRRLGVTAVELLPVWAFADEPALWGSGRTNYWGYNPIAFAAPHPAYGPPDAFCRMVEALHDAGLAVVLDVVINHTAEGGARGPTLSWRGLDNLSWYRLVEGNLAAYVDHTACGNSVQTEHPGVLAQIVNALRAWVVERGVDGFRFDLAVTPARNQGAFDPEGPFLRALAADPVLSSCLLIAEPWDAGPAGHALGRFPAPWLEWNDQARDAVRRFWLRGGSAGAFATALAGSSPVFPAERGPLAGVTYVTCHDGFALADLVAYDTKHNLANGEDNRDGMDTNHSVNHGVEGPTGEPGILALREQQRRNLILSLVLAQGVPMLRAGDELGQTHHGNNNPYCHDSPLTWLDWAATDPTFLAFVRQALALRQPGRCAFLTGQPGPDGWADVAWRRPDGHPMAADDWDDRAFALRLGAARLILVNGRATACSFVLPDDAAWSVVLASAPVDLPALPPLSVAVLAPDLAGE
ncbi:glycogen debranching protein GlgX [Pararhodospirillum photometricum]|nr:glycogen debranching protein GlgX [Pararhodospirillum photometricum]